MRLLAASAVVSVLVAVQSTVTPHPGRAEGPPTVRTRYVAETFQGKPIRWWASRAVKNRRTLNRFRHVMLDDGNVQEAIGLACAVYGNCATLNRKAACESHLNPRAHNPSGASGLFQFLPSTWRSTPFAAFSIFSPYANALAAGWMHRVGRGGEWVC